MDCKTAHAWITVRLFEYSSLAHFKNKISLEERSRISNVAQVSYFVEKLRLWSDLLLTWKMRGKIISTYVTIDSRKTEIETLVHHVVVLSKVVFETSFQLLQN